MSAPRSRPLAGQHVLDCLATLVKLSGGERVSCDAVVHGVVPVWISRFIHVLSGLGYLVGRGAVHRGRVQIELTLAAIVGERTTGGRIGVPE